MLWKTRARATIQFLLVTVSVLITMHHTAANRVKFQQKKVAAINFTNLCRFTKRLIKVILFPEVTDKVTPRSCLKVSFRTEESIAMA